MATRRLPTTIRGYERVFRRCARAGDIDRLSQLRSELDRVPWRDTARARAASLLAESLLEEYYAQERDDDERRRRPPSPTISYSPRDHGSPPPGLRLRPFPARSAT